MITIYLSNFYPDTQCTKSGWYSAVSSPAAPIMNSATWLVSSSSRFYHITPLLLWQLHCKLRDSRVDPVQSSNSLFLYTSVCTGQHRCISPMGSSAWLISRSRDSFDPLTQYLLSLNGCRPPSAIGPSLLLPVLLCLNMSRPNPLCLFPRTPQDFPVQAFVLVTLYRNFCSPCAVKSCPHWTVAEISDYSRQCGQGFTVVVFGHLNRVLFILRYLAYPLTYS